MPHESEYKYHGTVTQTAAAVISGCFAAGAFQKSADEKQPISVLFDVL